MKKRVFVLFAVVMLLGMVFAFSPAEMAYSALNVGYYELAAGSGAANQIPPITANGFTPVDISVPDAASLAGIDILFANNSSNGGYAAEWSANLADIEAAVASGMVLVFHDRSVDGAASAVPGAAGISFTRYVGTEDIDVETPGTLVTDGPFGILDDTSLDNGDSSSHGYVLVSTLPAGAVAILNHEGVSSHAVTIAYPYGDGWVIYSSIPLDYYLAGSSSNNPPRDNMVNIYAPNVLAYAASPTRGGSAPVPFVGTYDVGLVGSAEVNAVSVGDSLLWSFTISNEHPTLTTFGLSFRADVPDALAIDEVLITAGSGAVRPLEDGVIWADLDGLLAGEAAVVQIETTVVHASEVCITGAVVDVVYDACVDVYPGELPATGEASLLWTMIR